MVEPSIILECPKEVKEKIIDNYDAFIFDMDGVIWKINQPIPGVKEALDYLKQQNKLVYFATNNSLMRKAQFKGKLSRLGLGEFNEGQIYCSAHAVALYFKHIGFKGRLLVLGPKALHEELEELDGIEIVVLTTPPNINPYVMADYEIDQSIDAVVLGFALEIDYYKIAYITALLNSNPNCKFVATNYDYKLPTHRWLLPGAGAFMKSIEVATDRKPTIAGKPGSCIIDEIKKQNPTLESERICMVGDNLLTDVLFGKQNNLATILVETGVHNRQDLHKEKYKDIIPDYVLSSVAQLGPYNH